jgi:predicted metal-dependent phosphoesterase TrpH
LAIADHATTEGALALQKIAPFAVIVAEEVLTPFGEIMGMFLRETIPSPLSVEETVARIKGQGGLVCIPHPFDRLRGGSALNDSKLLEIIEQVDVIEVFNARTLMPGSIGRSRRLALEHGKPGSAGSDAHTPAEIGNAYVEMDEFRTTAEFLKSLAVGRVVGWHANPLGRISSTIAKVSRRRASRH